jgi:hypothetical protein
MKRFLIFALTLVLTNLGNWIFRGCEVSKLNDLIKVQKDEIKLDSVVIAEMRFEIDKLKQKDSSNQFFINQKELVMIQLRNDNRDTKKKLLDCERWREDAKDGVVTDTVRVRKRLFRKGFKILPLQSL